MNTAEQQHADMQVGVWCGDATGGALQHYEVPRYRSQTILDVVTWIQRHRAPALTYRFACRVGMCGSCAMMVNGVPRWTCRTHVDKALGSGNSLTIEPLRNLPVIKDLATDMSEFFDKWVKAEARHYPTLSRRDPIPAIDMQEPKRRAASAAIECINCAVCYAACDVVASNPHYLGPAALNRAWTLINDARDNANNKRLRAVSDSSGCHNCHSHQSCSAHCPNELNPTASIAGLKRSSAVAALKGQR